MPDKPQRARHDRRKSGRWSRPASRLALLDRDGTINVDRGFVHRWEDFEFCAGAVEALRRLAKAGFLLVVVSNQGGIARNYYTHQDVVVLHRKLMNYLKAYDVQLAGCLYCPHAPEDRCRCRKPGTFLVEQFVKTQNLRVDWPGCWTIGDKPSDVMLGKRLGTCTALLRSVYWSPEALEVEPDLVGDSLLEVTERILAQGGKE
ncbi:MAG: D-glycero-alpha-D-manno-heptose-1,7-bisphosphate 7-phosphatase [Pirellulaceae bacterium]|nr:MAG: D-glycero-alpha-D-manno-heptose-1,7-bisphosphate 7-phosphatase [Pirellulaceae bacterium]